MTTQTRPTADPLYVALDKYEDASNLVGAQTIVAQGAFRQLTDAIRGFGDLAEATARFHLESTILGGFHEEWLSAAQQVAVEAAAGVAWQANPFEELDRQPYGEQGVLGTDQL